MYQDYAFFTSRKTLLNFLIFNCIMILKSTNYLKERNKKNETKLEQWIRIRTNWTMK